jgi:hypothetical protein
MHRLDGPATDLSVEYPRSACVAASRPVVSHLPRPIETAFGLVLLSAFWGTIVFLALAAALR